MYKTDNWKDPTSPTWWTWVCANLGSWWWTGKPGLLQSMGSQRVEHHWDTELNWWVFIYIMLMGRYFVRKDASWELPGGPVVRTLFFYCRGLRFDSWLVNWDPTRWMAWPKKRKDVSKKNFQILGYGFSCNCQVAIQKIVTNFFSHQQHVKVLPSPNLPIFNIALSLFFWCSFC